MLAGARHRFDGKPGLEFERADAAEMRFAKGTFDTANIANAVHCFPDVDGALRDVLRVLKPGGSLAANVLLYPRGGWPWRQIAERINRWGMRKGILYTPYDQADIRERLLKAGFVIDFEEVSGNCYNVRAHKPVSP
jgi:SAM-dependent methyltransferase